MTCLFDFPVCALQDSLTSGWADFYYVACWCCQKLIDPKLIGQYDHRYINSWHSSRNKDRLEWGEKERSFWKVTSSLRNSPPSFDLKQNLIVMKNNTFPDEYQTQPWFQSVLWDCYGGTNFQHGGKFVPQNSPTMHFETISTRSPAASKWLDVQQPFVGSWEGGVGFILGVLGLVCQAIHSEIQGIFIQSLYFAVFIQFFFVILQSRKNSWSLALSHRLSILD